MFQFLQRQPIFWIKFNGMLNIGYKKLRTHLSDLRLCARGQVTES